MAFFVEVLDRIDLKMYGTLHEQRIISTFSLFCDNGDAGGVEWGEVVSDLDAAFSDALSLFPKFRACCPPEYLFEYSQYQLWKGTTKFLATRVNHNQNGTAEGKAETANLAAVLLRRGDFGSRRSVSTLHVPIGTTDEYIDNGIITAGLKGSLNAVGTTLKQRFSSTGGGKNIEFVFCIPNGPNATQNTPITFTQAMNTVRVMRRRTVGLGV